MSVVLIPDFSSQLVEGLWRNIAVRNFDPIEPNEEIVPLLFGQR